MSRWVTRAYASLFALVPILNFAARNPDQFGPRDLLPLVAFALAGSLAVYAVAAVVLRRRGPEGLAPFIALLAVVWFFGYAPLASHVLPRASDPPHAILVPLGLALTAAVVWWIHRRTALLDGLGRFFTLMGVLLVTWSSVQMVSGWLRGRSAIAESALVRDLARPIQGPMKTAGPQRDIYLIVLDEYANAAVMRERLRFDNRPFEDSLKALGFYVPRVVRSNYAHTLLSLPSLLNTAHLTRIEREVGPQVKHPALPNYILRHSRVASYLEARGYRYIFFPSQWWYSTSDVATADDEFQAWSGFNFSRMLTAGELQRTVRGESVLRYLHRDHRWEAAHVRRSLEGVAEVPALPGPTFTFAHILKPHDPYVFDRDCGVLKRQRETSEVGPYVEQVQCINRLVLATVREILQRSSVPPIILLQGDHGTSVLGATGYDDPAAVPAAAARERFGAFGAYYLPAGGAREFGDTVTVVNVLGNVLRYYFDAHVPRAADDQYMSPAASPYEFRRLDARWLAGDHSAVPVLRAGR